MKSMRKNNRSNRGSALLVSLMVMVGLSLLGLGFVVISETESNISVNERNHAQVLGVAEAGAKLVLEWFQDPVWADTQGLLPANVNTSYPTGIKRTRTSVVASTTYTGKYKDAGGLLFDKPHRPSSINRFFGTATNPDIQIDAGNSATFLANINAALFADLNDGQITEIRIYAPPVIGGNINANGFWEGGVRYGLATIQVTASKFVNNRVAATRVVRLVISEWPFPGPQGPVQSNANISTGGSFGVHWGRMTSELDMEVKNPWIGMPWLDAWNSLPFEYGYYQPGQSSTGQPLVPADRCKQENWLYKIQGVPIQDLWFTARAKRDLLDTNGTPLFATNNYHPFKFSDPAQGITTVPLAAFSNQFQRQDVDANAGNPCGGRDQQLVVFPKIDYEFWKSLSQSASTTNSGVKYLRWVDGEEYTDGVSTKRFGQWVNTMTGAKAGFYFFDTRNGLNPQGSGAAGILAPPVTLNSSDDGHTFLMKGFIYLNAEQFGTQGINGGDAWYNFPGEPFRDVGFLKVDEAALTFTTNPDGTRNITGGGAFALDPVTSVPVIDGAGTGEWEFQDLNKNGVLDIFVAQRAVTVPGAAGTQTFWFPVPWAPNCIPGFNGAAGATCSEPHEPYLNLVYPSSGGTAQACCGGGGDPRTSIPMWENPASFTRLAKVKTAGGAPVACPAGFSPNCTSNSYDRDGPLTQDFGGNSLPMLDGVLYNEGDYNSPGNANYYGSILINGDIGGRGTAEVWFDEFLIKGGWQDKFKELPRVFVTAHETEQ